MTEQKPEQTKSDQQLAKEFVKEYEALCEKYGLIIQVVPQWLARDDGTFSTKLISSVSKLIKQ